MKYNTRNRQLILDYIQSKSDSYVSIKEIHEALLKNGHHINISTIYRYIDYLLNTQTITRQGNLISHLLFVKD